MKFILYTLLIITGCVSKQTADNRQPFSNDNSPQEKPTKKIEHQDSRPQFPNQKGQVETYQKETTTSNPSVEKNDQPQTFASNNNTNTGWVSGGGEVIKSQLNPWFLYNTKEVHYCIIKKSDFETIPHNLQKIVSDAITFWKNQFATINIAPLSKFDPNTTLATQQFIFHDTCNENIDLIFQFGFLTDKQKINIPNYKDFAALTIRTEYDEVNMKGKGFIYIASYKDASIFSDQEILKEPWHHKNPNFLSYTILHELGHVFGIQHMEEGLVMQVSFVNDLLKSKNESYVLKFDEIPSENNHLFRYTKPMIHSSCSSAYTRMHFKVFLLHPFYEGEVCLYLLLNLEKTKGDLYARIYGQANSQVQIGTIQLDPISKVTKPSFEQSAIKVRLPKQQNIFEPNENEIVFAKFSTFKVSGVYIDEKKMSERPIVVEFHPGGWLSFFGFHGSEMVSIFKYD